MEFVVIAVIGVGIITTAIRNLYYICQPNEVLIFAGTTRWVPSLKRRVGYRLVKGGSSLRMPLFERVLRLDLTNFQLAMQCPMTAQKLGTGCPHPVVLHGAGRRLHQTEVTG